MYGMQRRGVSELRDLEQNEFKSVGAKDFVAEMQELHSKIKERLQSSNQEYKRREDQHKKRVSVRSGRSSLSTSKKGKVPQEEHIIS
jgi:hypothetical protein